MRMRRSILVVLALSSLLEASGTGSRVQYVGGTVAGVPTKSDARIELLTEDSLTLNARGTVVRVPYADINTIEYGMRVSRRYMEAVLISPIFLVAKKRSHFLTIGYSDSEGTAAGHGSRRWEKKRSGRLLVSLEARGPGVKWNSRMRKPARRVRVDQIAVDLAACLGSLLSGMRLLN